MYRWIRDAMVLSVMSVSLAVAVLAAGTAIPHATPEDPPPDLWPVAECHTSNVTALGDSGASGSALLCMADSAVRPAVFLSGMVPGRSYRAQILQFQQPVLHTDPCTTPHPSEWGLPMRVGHIADTQAKSDGTVQIRGHVAGWAVSSILDLVLLVTTPFAHESVQAVASARDSLSLPMLHLTGSHAATTVAIARFRFGPCQTSPSDGASRLAV